MSFLKGLESFQARMEEDAVVEETSVDVEVKVAEEVEAATQIVEEATSVVTDAEASDAAAEDVEAVEHFIASIKKHGLTQQGLELMNRNGILEAISGVALPAVESLDSTGRNHEAAQAALEASEGIIKKSWEAIKKFFKGLWEKIKALWAKFMSYITSWESSIKKAKEALPEAIDAKKAKDKDVTTLKYATFQIVCDGVMTVTEGLASSIGSPEKKDVVKDYFKKKENGMIAIGLKFEGDDLVQADKAPESSSMKFAASGWDLDKLKSGGFKGAQDTVAALRGIKDFPAAFGKACDGGIKMADSLAKSSGKEHDEKLKGELEALRGNVAMSSKIAAKVAARATIVPRAYISACAAAKACAA